MAELGAVRDELIQKEMELEARAKALAAEQQRLAKEQQALDDERQELLKLRDEVELVRSRFLELERMRSIYAEMRARDAAAIMRELAAGACRLHLERHGSGSCWRYPGQFGSQTGSGDYPHESK